MIQPTNSGPPTTEEIVQPRGESAKIVATSIPPRVITPTSRPKKRKAETPNYIEEAINKLQEIKTSVENSKDDEFTSFGKNVADQLRQLPLDTALNAQVQYYAIFK